VDLRWEILAGYGPLFVEGLWTTVKLTVVAVGVGLAVKAVLAAGAMVAAAGTPAIRSRSANRAT